MFGKEKQMSKVPLHIACQKSKTDNEGMSKRAVFAFHILNTLISGLNTKYHQVLQNILELMTTGKSKLFNNKDRDDNTPLNLDIGSGSSEVVRILLEHGAEVQKYKQKTNALHFCAR
jgi:ankyrin repeat protein